MVHAWRRNDRCSKRWFAERFRRLICLDGLDIFPVIVFHDVQTHWRRNRCAGTNFLLIQTAKELATAEKLLIQGEFISVGTLTGGMVPDVPGLYCIKLRKGAKLPAKFGKVREDGIIYIGQASTSLRQRFWKQELNHIGAATFFRSIGAMLGYMPPKGSLVGKKNQNNFKFSPEDTESIREWMKKSLIVNCIPFSTETMDAVEKKLIDNYRPLVNNKHNPDYSRELEAAKEKCREYARSK